MKAWIFDIDGVITNLITRKIEYPEILQIIAQKLHNKEPVGLVTGRAILWALYDVIRPLEEHTKNREDLDFFIFEGEFGAASLSFKDGKEVFFYDQTFSPSEELLKKGREIIEGYEDLVFFDAKKSFYTAEMRKDVKIKDFKEKQGEIAKKLQKLVNDSSLSDSFEVHQDTIAVNVKNKNLTKYLATRKFLEWLSAKGLSPEMFSVFGDSESDLQIGDELYNQGKNFEFIFTGEVETENKPFKIIKVGNYDKGTLEYLKNN